MTVAAQIIYGFDIKKCHCGTVKVNRKQMSIKKLGLPTRVQNRLTYDKNRAYAYEICHSRASGNPF
jgi:hypothetical protein